MIRLFLFLFLILAPTVQAQQPGISPASQPSLLFAAASTAGSANAQTITTTTGTWTNTVNYVVSYVAGATNTGAMTMAVDGQTAKNVYKRTTSGAVAGTLIKNPTITRRKLLLPNGD